MAGLVRYKAVKWNKKEGFLPSFFKFRFLFSCLFSSQEAPPSPQTVNSHPNLHCYKLYNPGVCFFLNPLYPNNTPSSYGTFSQVKVTREHQVGWITTEAVLIFCAQSWIKGVSVQGLSRTMKTANVAVCWLLPVSRRLTPEFWGLDLYIPLKFNLCSEYLIDLHLICLKCNS